MSLREALPRDDDFFSDVIARKSLDFRGNPFKTPQNSSRLVKLKVNLLPVTIHSEYFKIKAN